MQHYNTTSIIRSVDNGNLDMARLLVANNADVNIPHDVRIQLYLSVFLFFLCFHFPFFQTRAWTALHYATNVEIAKFLVANGAKVDRQTKVNLSFSYLIKYILLFISYYSITVWINSSNVSMRGKSSRFGDIFLVEGAAHTFKNVCRFIFSTGYMLF